MSNRTRLMFTADPSRRKDGRGFVVFPAELPRIQERHDPVDQLFGRDTSRTPLLQLETTETHMTEKGKFILRMLLNRRIHKAKKQ